MIAYREQRRRVRTQDALSRIASSCGFERQMEIGELESGVADLLCPEYDSDLPVLRELRSWSAGYASGPLSSISLLPPEFEASVPEGFAYYALDPRLYALSARRFISDRGQCRVAVIGIRSIGATLSAVVEAELRSGGCETCSWTVRPRGHAWDRCVRVSEDLAQTWRAWDGEFLIVDEGPGLSGTSFCSVAELLSSLGVADGRISFFPSWTPDGGAFVAEAARNRWRRHRKYCAEFEELGLFPGARDLSGGQWRQYCGCWPAVQPQHERRKYLFEGRLHKFAGYGRYGRAKIERAGALSGFTPQPEGVANGFLFVPWIEGRQAPLSHNLVRYAGRYLAFVRREFALGSEPSFEDLAELIATNAPEAPDAWHWRQPVQDGQAVALDARMFPHEWIETPSGFLKVDALEHCDDHFFPGPQDAAWDIAAFCIEHKLDSSGRELLIGLYRRESGDRGVTQRLPFYRLAYLAFRLGYTDLAMQALGQSEEGERFRALHDRYARLLRKEVGGGE